MNAVTTVQCRRKDLFHTLSETSPVDRSPLGPLYIGTANK